MNYSKYKQQLKTKWSKWDGQYAEFDENTEIKMINPMETTSKYHQNHDIETENEDDKNMNTNWTHFVARSDTYIEVPNSKSCSR